MVTGNLISDILRHIDFCLLRAGASSLFVTFLIHLLQYSLLWVVPDIPVTLHVLSSSNPVKISLNIWFQKDKRK